DDVAQEVQQSLKYLVGSGRHSRTYLVELDGFLMESPVTWYASTKTWSMSPGYDHAGHSGFERAADFGCLVCHVGTAEPIGRALNRLLISETAIGCERCHGPGAAHVDKWKSIGHVDSGSDQPPDNSILHPGQLSRELQEAICSQCHLRGEATVFLPGKSVDDFRPGESLTATRIDYQLERNSGDMTVVGHVDQMHASRCYQQSSTMTCSTCHDSHAERLPDNAAGFYRNKCIQCHSNDACGISISERQKRDTTDNCVKCHMPQAPTDIPHIAFTHHRIGIHDATSPARSESKVPGRLVPFGDVSGLSKMQQQRCLGLACAELIDRGLPPDTARHYRELAIELLEGVVQSGEADGDVFAAMARFAWEDEKPRQAQAYAQQALSDAKLSSKARVNSLLISGDCFLQNRQSSNAVVPLEELVKLRRSSQDWLLLGISRFQSGQKQSGITAVRQATLIQPFRTDLPKTLSDMQRAAKQ
ncbi:MAG: multiheme c-type cytochrome, partial [Planctomycetia bacterium]